MNSKFNPQATPSFSSSEEGWINSAKASRYLGISLVTLRRWVREKRVTPKRTPTGEFRFKRSELDNLLS